jgi:Zn-finger nucleic acid-binding protein
MMAGKWVMKPCPVCRTEVMARREDAAQDIYCDRRGGHWLNPAAAAIQRTERERKEQGR